MSPVVRLLLILVHEFTRDTNTIRKVESQRGFASHCEVKTSSEWDSKTFESSKIKDLFSVSLKRLWGMGITYWVLSQLRQSTGFEMFLVDRKGETLGKIKLMPIVSSSHCTPDWRVWLPSPRWPPHRHWGGCEVSPKPSLPQAGQAPCPGLSSRTLLQPWPSLNSVQFINVFHVLGGSKLATVSRYGLVSGEQKEITNASLISWLCSCWCSPGCCWPSLLPGDAGGSCSSNWLE